MKSGMADEKIYSKAELLDKIRKLQALAARAGTEHEAALAAERAAAMLTKYKLDISEVPNQPEMREGVEAFECGYPGGHKLAAWALNLLSAVADTCYCDVVYHSWKKSYTLIGKPTDTQVANEMYLFLLDQIRRLIRKHRPEGVEGMSLQHARRAFAIGCSARVRDRLRAAFYAQQRQADIGKQVTALVVVSKQEVEAKKKALFPRLRTMRSRAQSAQKFAGSFAAGIKAGDSVTLGVQRKINKNPNTKLLG